MPDWREILSGAGTGASAGFTTGAALGAGGGPIGMGIGAVVGAGVGMFSQSPEQQRQERIGALLKRITEMKQQGMYALKGQTEGMMASWSQNAARRAASAGVGPTGTEAFMLPGVEKAATAGSEAMKNYLQGWQGVQADIASGIANRPLPESPVDIFGAAAGGLASGIQAKKTSDMWDRYFSSMDELPDYSGLRQMFAQRNVPEDTSSARASLDEMLRQWLPNTTNEQPYRLPDFPR